MSERIESTGRNEEKKKSHVNKKSRYLLALKNKFQRSTSNSFYLPQGAPLLRDNAIKGRIFFPFFFFHPGRRIW